jgi:hypothetical protein
MNKLAFALLFVALAAYAAAADVTGTWSGTFVPEGGDSSTAYLVIKQSGTAITGTAGPDASTQWNIQAGKIEGNKVTIEVKDSDSGTVYKCSMVLNGTKMTGDVEASSGGQIQKGKIDISKAS